MSLFDSIKSGAQKAVQVSQETLGKAKELASESLSSEKLRQGKDIVAGKLQQGKDFVTEKMPEKEKIKSTFSRLRDSATSAIKRK